MSALKFNTKQTFEVEVDGEVYELKKLSVHERAEIIRDFDKADKDDAMALELSMQKIVVDAGLPPEVYKTLLPEHLEALNEVMLGAKKS